MSNKPFNQLNEVDQLLRKLFPPEMKDGVQVKIEKICGFELFNSRPYHNHETFSDGYKITVGEIVVMAEDLDEALDLLIKKLNKPI